MASLSFVTPSDVAQCQSAALLWGGGTPPYTVSVLDGSNGLESRGLATVGSFFDVHTSYTVPFPANQIIIFQVTDNKQQSAKTNIIAVGPSDDDSCLPASLRSTTQPATTTTTKNAQQSSVTQTQSDASTASSDSAASSSTKSSTKSASSTSGSSSNPSGTSTTATLPSSISGAPTSSDVTGLSASSSRSSSAPASSSTAPAAANKSSLSPGLFAGAATVGVVFILVIAGFLLWRRQHRRKVTDLGEDWFAMPNHHHMDGYESNSGHHTPMRSFGPLSSTSSVSHGAQLVDTATPTYDYTVDTAHYQPADAAYYQPVDAAHSHSAAQWSGAPQDYYNSDPKSRQVLRASTHLASVASPPSSSGTPRRQASTIRGPARTSSEELPTHLSQEEMVRLADLVASRIGREQNAEEPPPMYH